MSVYISLFHGRNDPDAIMEDWGEPGPLLGPFEWIQVSYLKNIRVGFLDEKGNNQDGMFAVVDDMVFYDGMYYGDYDILSASRLSTRDMKKSMAERFDQSLTKVTQERDV